MMYLANFKFFMCL